MITGRYLLIIHIPHYRLPDGRVATGAAWAKDLALHFGYISDLRLCAPVEEAAEMQPDWREVPELAEAGRLVPLRKRGGKGRAAINLVADFVAIRRAVRQADIVHAGLAGWPFPLAWYVLLLRPFYRFKWISLMESSFWLAGPDSGPVRRATSAVAAAMAGWCMRAADLRIFTQRGYRERFLGDREPALVAPAVWVGQEGVRDALGPEDDALFAEPGLRVVMATRLVPEKGIDVFLDALERLAADPGAALGPVQATLYGEGPMRAAAEAVAARLGPAVRLDVAGTMDYGPDFFAALRRHHLMVLTNRTAEQPRNLYDALSQGRGVLSTRTEGTVDAVETSGAGELFPIDDAEALAGLLRRYARDPSAAKPFGARALRFMRRQSHERMHLTRQAFLEANLGDSLTGPPRAALDAEVATP